ncbi:MAG: ATP-binding cassette domain-containing protein, partial [Gammaproteobacteria bacterium]|nr:ATP-binding cassette domain-containing protein [Gammaproteobacteria bacterium]
EIIQNGLAASGSVFGLMDETPERDDGNRELARAKGRIEYRDVVFSYDENSGTFLDHIFFTIEAGQTVALVGHSGSGKSTIVSLLLRFYRPDEGEIRLDDVPINELTLEALRSNISIVTQETILFDDSIRNNIAYGNACSIDEERLQNAAKAAHVLEFAEQTNLGLDTVVGEQGIRLSGGQRQRIAIARALYKDAPILIMDEATSALDSESERLVREATHALIQNRTTMIIAHRLSTIEQADKILVLDAGKIVEQGKHNELIQKNGAYAKLHSMQFASSNG